MVKIKKPLREIIYNQLVEDIVYGKINPGEKLVESDLSKRFHVSRTPIREVLLQLEKGKYISLKKNVGAVVNKVSIKRVREVFSLLAQLEGYAVEIAAQEKISVDDITYLMKLQKTMEDSIASKDYFMYVKKNLAFHAFFVDRCENETLRDLVVDLRQRIYKVVSEGLTLPIYVDNYLASHRKIIEAFPSGSPPQVGNLMKAHLMDTMKFVTAIMKKSNRYNL